jgi:NAD-dependent dihydropyrimidine dehydrogenase PreA subunit
VLTATDVMMAQLNGVAAVEGFASRLSGGSWWRNTPCPAWTAADLMGHLACMAEDYNHALDAITDGAGEAVLRSADIDQHNAIRLLEISGLSPLARARSFGLAARRFAARTSAFASLHAFNLRARPWTVGMYGCMCAIEWHVHAWDLGRSIDVSYRPADIPTLLRLWDVAFPYLPLPSGEGWAALLACSGRGTGPGRAQGAAEFVLSQKIQLVCRLRKEHDKMTYIIAQPCVDVLDRACVDECPVDCIYEGARMLYINPDECVDCAACEPVCPVEAICFEDNVPSEWAPYLTVNAEFFSDLGSPGGARQTGKIDRDHPLVAALPPQVPAV